MPDEQSEIVLAELERILASASFRNTKRSQEFLRYIVINTLEARYDALKERMIGAAIFQKPVDYDTAADSAVRGKASELRMRLAQFYVETGLDHPVTIALPVGSYVPEFRWAATPVAETEFVEVVVPPRRTLFARRYLYLSIAVVLCAAAVLLYLPSLPRSAASPSALDQFWQPVLDNQRPVLLCVANPVVFRMRNGGELSWDPRLKIDSSGVRASDLIPSNYYVGFGDASCLARLSGFFDARSKVAQIRKGDETAFTDLRNSPVVLIGGFSNEWTMKITGNLRFAFQRVGELDTIQDQMNPARSWDDASPDADYALITRVFDSRTGDLLIVAAGIDHDGTQIAGEFLTSARYMNAAFHTAPNDWKRRNLQVILKTELVGNTPGPPNVVETYFW